MQVNNKKESDKETVARDNTFDFTAVFMDKQSTMLVNIKCFSFKTFPDQGLSFRPLSPITRRITSTIWRLSSGFVITSRMPAAFTRVGVMAWL